MSAIQWFDSALLAIGRGEIDLASDALKLGLVTGVVMAEDDATPAWGPAGATNLASAEVAAGASYAGPVTLTGVDWSIDEGRVALTAERVRIGPDRAGAQNVEAFVIFDDSHPDKLALAWGEVEHSLRNGALILDLPLLLAMESVEAGVLRRYPTLLAAPTSQYPEIVQDQPEYLEPVQFGDLETVVVRITDSNNQAHTYATQQAFNADQTKVMLYHSGNGAMVLDTATWSVLRSGITGSGSSAGVHQFWDPINPSILWRHASSGDQLSAYDFSTDTSQTWTVSAESGSPYTTVRIGEGEGTISADGRYIALVCRRGDGNVYVAVWDTVLNSVEGTLTLEDWSIGGSGLDNAHVSPSGDYVVLASKRAGNLGHLIYDRETLTFQRAYTGGVGTNSNDGFPGHMDIGYRTNGDECLVRLRKDGGLVTVRLSDGDERLEVPAAHMSWGVHVSCRNRLRPGYAYVSMYYVDYDYAKYLRHEVFAVRLDGSGRIERFGQAMFPDDGSYALQTKATVSPYGDMVLMTSGWGTTTPREYVMYVPETMPEPEPDWLGFMDFTDPDNLFQDRAGETAVTTVGNRIGRVEDPKTEHFLSETDGDNTRFTWKHDGVRNYAESSGANQYLTDRHDGAWFDPNVNERHPWWFCVAIQVEQLTGSSAVLWKRHQGSPVRDARVRLEVIGEEVMAQVQRRSGTTLTASTTATAVTDEVVVISGGYDGSSSTVRVNFGTKASQADTNALPDTSQEDPPAVWIGSNNSGSDVLRYYAMGFMDHYPSAEEEEAAIKQAGAIAGLTL